MAKQAWEDGPESPPCPECNDAVAVFPADSRGQYMCFVCDVIFSPKKAKRGFAVPALGVLKKDFK